MPENPLPVARSRAEIFDAIRNYRNSRQTIGLVPTMGALHDGHLSLVGESRARTDRTVVSIYVNPAQFAPGEDFDAYPRETDSDLAKLAEAGCDLVYLPREEDMYPPGSLTQVRVDTLSDRLDGRHRPHFFYGVATVVARLFAQVRPDLAVFGEKDFQQLQIIRRMASDLGFPIEIIGAPTVRAPDGLAHSSRNAYLGDAERRRAGALFAALHRARKRIAAGAPVGECLAEARAYLRAASWDSVDYVSAVDPATLEDLPDGPLGEPEALRLLGAGHVGTTRLIDNMGPAD